MAVVPSIPVFSTGTGVTAAQLAQLAAVSSFALNPPRVLIYKAASTSRVSSSTPGVIQWDTALVNSDSNWAISPNASRLVCQTPGLYEIELAVHYSLFSTSSTANGGAQLGVALNNAGTWPGVGSTNRLEETTMFPTGVFGESMNLKFEYFLNAGDYIEAFSGQVNSAGAAETLNPNGTFFDMHFGMRWVSVS